MMRRLRMSVVATAAAAALLVCGLVTQGAFAQGSIPTRATGYQVLAADWNTLVAAINNLNASNLTTGTVPIARRTVTQTVASTGTLNDLALTAGVEVMYMTNASTATITGLSASGVVDGQRIWIRNAGASNVNLVNQSAGSAAGNRFSNIAAGTYALSPSGWAEYVYEGANSVFRMLGADGGWFDVPFDAGNFTTNGGGSITPAAAGHPYVYRYAVVGKTMWLQCSAKILVNNGATTDIRFAIPGGYTPKAYDVLSGADENQAREGGVFNSTSAAGAAGVFINVAGKYVSVQRWDGTPGAGYVNGENVFVGFTMTIPLT